MEPNCHDHCFVSARGEWGYAEWKAYTQAEHAALRQGKEADAHTANVVHRFRRRKRSLRQKGQR